MEARKLIFRLPAYVGGKGRHHPGIAFFQFGKRLQIILGRGTVVLLDPKGFESTERFGLVNRPGVRTPIGALKH